MSRPPDDRELWLAYKSTIFCATVDGVALCIRPGRRHSTLDCVLATRGVTTWAFVTAWNPGSQPLHPEENPAHQNRLETDVRNLGFEMFSGVGEPLDSEWPPERSLLILGISPDAIALGHSYGQVAIVVGKF